MQSSNAATGGGSPEALSAIGKVNRRLLPFLMLMFVLAFLDRVNVGFAKEQLEVDVGISAAAYGLGAGIFFLAYTVLEVPSNLIMHRVGARLWLSRIMITWGLVAAATAFVQGPTSFYVVRVLLGIAEAGFFPGVILYLTYWYPNRFRGGATGLFYWGLPLAFIFGAPLSGVLLELDGLGGLFGWQWMFLIEGLAASVVGVWALFYLNDKPSDASWLEPRERTALQQWVREEDRERGEHRPLSVLGALRDLNVIYFGLIYFFINLSLYGVSFWLPTTVGSIGGLSSWQVGLISAIPWICAAIGLYLVSRRADRTDRHKQYAAICLGAAALGIALSASFGPILSVAALCLAAFGFISVLPVFWSMPTSYLSGVAAAGGIALVNSIGNLGGFTAPYVLGLVEEGTGSVRLGLYALAVTTIIGTFLIVMSRQHNTTKSKDTSKKV